nr:transposase [Lactobacillus crispatus]
MIRLSDLGQVYIVCGKTDLRKGIDGLATLVKEQFELDPLVVKFSSFAAEARTASKPFIGMGKVSGCYTKDLRTEN